MSSMSRMRVRSAVKLLLCVLSVVLLILTLNALLPPSTATHHLTYQFAVPKWNTSLQIVFGIDRGTLPPENTSLQHPRPDESDQGMLNNPLQQPRPDGSDQGVLPPENNSLQRPRPDGSDQGVLPPENNSLQRPRPDSQLQRKHKRQQEHQSKPDRGLYIQDLGDFYDPLLYKDFTPLRHEVVNDVRTFVFFVGWQRSGHSIVGSLLDGHPDAIIAHEFFLFSRLNEFIHRMNSRVILFNQLAANSFREATRGFRSRHHNEKGYNLQLTNSWQGRFRTLRVIGDKTAGDVTNAYIKNSTVFEYNIERLKWMAKAPLRVINVVRNPFDMIATLSLYRGSPLKNMKLRATVQRRYRNQLVIEKAADTILLKARCVYEMENKKYDWDFIRIYSEDFIKDPQSVMAELCTFLGLECTESYLQQCADKTYKSPSRSRELIVWDKTTRERVEEAIKEIPFFSRYSFDGE